MRITDPIFFSLFFLTSFLEALLQLFTFFFFVWVDSIFIYFYFLGLNLECKSALELVPHDRNLNHQVQRDNFKVLGYAILLRGPIIFQFWVPTSSCPRSYWMPPFGNVLVIHLQGVPSIFLPVTLWSVNDVQSHTRRNFCQQIDWI